MLSVSSNKQQISYQLPVANEYTKCV